MSDTSQSSSSGGGYSTSTSVPTINPFLQQLAQASAGMANSVFNWAQGQFANDSNITNQTVQSFFQTSAKALAQAQNDTSRYENIFQPQENNLVADANSYASPARTEMQMGSAEAQNAQAFQSQRNAATQTLQSYGIDPSSGMYGELNDTLASQQAAAGAGAAQQAEQATEATGRALRSEAIQVGERYPQNITNELNTSLAANSAAENATLANANTGVNLQDAAAPYIKFPPVGQATNSNSKNSNSGQSNSNKPPPPDPAPKNSNPNNNNGGGRGNGGGGLPATEPTGGGGLIPNPYYTGPDQNNNGGYYSNQNSYNMDPSNPNFDPYSAVGALGYNTGAGSSSQNGAPGSDNPSPFYDPYSASNQGANNPTGLGNGDNTTAPNTQFQGPSIPSGANDQFGTFPGGGMTPGLNPEGGDSFAPPSAQGLSDPFGGNTSTDFQGPDQMGGGNPSDFSDAGAQDSGANDITGSIGDQSGGNQSGGDQSGGYYSGGDQSGGGQSGGDQSGGDQSGGDQSGGDQSGGDQSGGDYSGGGGYYAKGGAIGAIPLPPHPGRQHIGGFPVQGRRQPKQPMLNRQDGGRISPQASPSAGRKVDDVNVHANVGEFMMPKDVVAWKGQEYFQKLIAQSRKARMTGSPAQGSRTPPPGA